MSTASWRRRRGILSAAIAGRGTGVAVPPRGGEGRAAIVAVADRAATAGPLFSRFPRIGQSGADVDIQALGHVVGASVTVVVRQPDAVAGLGIDDGDAIGDDGSADQRRAGHDQRETGRDQRVAALGGREERAHGPPPVRICCVSIV
ncbi:hypothetical protein CUR86_19455 [Salinicola acroporae]|uniref:Uncharacterized protein n=1 Tax=Salinicola acroporae TaxID=1541440 RepID=A0ABT6IAM4_9GAMM|nr:hypothetical protein [Salinicola acroporae]